MEERVTNLATAFVSWDVECAPSGIVHDRRISTCVNRSRIRHLMHVAVHRMESDPLLDAHGSGPVSKPARCDRSVGDIAKTWSRSCVVSSEVSLKFLRILGSQRIDRLTVAV
jgi:hypothetical protein